MDDPLGRGSTAGDMPGVGVHGLWHRSGQKLLYNLRAHFPLTTHVIVAILIFCAEPPGFRLSRVSASAKERF